MYLAPPQNASLRRVDWPRLADASTM